VKKENEKNYGKKGMEVRISKQKIILYRILGRAAPVTFQFFTGAIEKVMKLYEEQRNDWSIRKVSFFCFSHFVTHKQTLVSHCVSVFLGYVTHYHET